MNPASLLIFALCLATYSHAAHPARDTDAVTVRVLVLNYDPVLSNGMRLSRAMKWNDPRPMTTNLLRYLRECSGGFARYELADFVDVNAFPLKRDGFRRAFARCGKTRRRRTSPTASATRRFSKKTTSSRESTPKN